MFENLLKIIGRNLYRQKTYSIINVFGLAIGIACALLIYLWVQNELSFDKFHKNADTLYTLYEEQYYQDEDRFTIYATPGPLASTLKARYSEVEMVSRYVSSWGKVVVRTEDNSFVEERIRMVDPDFLKMFSFPILSGDASNPMESNQSVVLTESLAQKYFGEEDPVGKLLLINKEFSFQVTAIVSDPPANSSLQFDMLLPMDFVARNWDYDLGDWQAHSFQTLIKLREGVNLERFEREIENLIQEMHSQSTAVLKLQAFDRMHLHDKRNEPAGQIRYVRMFALLSFLILLIACFNFMNLNTARSEKRAREVGIRKVVGAQRHDLVIQFFIESLSITLLAFGVAIALVEVFLPLFNQLANRELVLQLTDIDFLLGIAGIVLLTGILSGIYPAFFLSSYKPVKVLKGINRKESLFFRRLLVIIQFVMSVGLIFSTMIINQQLHFIKNKDIGYNRENLVYFEIVNNFKQHYPVLREELMKVPGVHWVTSANQMPVDVVTSIDDVVWSGKDLNQDMLFQMCYVDYDFVETFEIQMKDGRSFSSRYGSDSLKFIINESAARSMGMESPVGKMLSVWGNEGSIIGVVKDFNYNSLQEKIDPLILIRDPGACELVAIRLQGGESMKILRKIRRIWDKVVPDEPFNYKFLKDDFNHLYRFENRMSNLFHVFSFLAVLISCLGLFGLASFVAERRTKEMGIRKVMGASVEKVFSLLIRQFFMWILYANIIAWPIAHWLMEEWLKGFAYRISINWGIFLVSGLISIGIAILTVAYQAIRVAVSNPVHSIKYE